MRMIALGAKAALCASGKGHGEGLVSCLLCRSQRDDLCDAKEECVRGEEEGPVSSCGRGLHLRHERGEVREQQCFAEHSREGNEESCGGPFRRADVAPS